MRFLFLIGSIAFASLAHADNLDILCGEGADSYDVDKAQVALVAQDNDYSIYFSGKQDTTYAIKATRAGFRAVPANAGSHNPSPTFEFASCKDGESTATLLSSMTSPAQLKCLCVEE